jgi:hypothetical protein
VLDSPGAFNRAGRDESRRVSDSELNNRPTIIISPVSCFAKFEFMGFLLFGLGALMGARQACDLNREAKQDLDGD